MSGNSSISGRYSGLSDNPVYGLCSRDFARFAAEVYAANGVEVHLPDPEGKWILSTPELSYAIRALDAHGGLNVSASHNHPDDNGGKFYDEKGGQEYLPTMKSSVPLWNKSVKSLEFRLKKGKLRG